MKDEPNSDTQAFHDTARAPDSANPTHKSLLLGHALATLTSANTVTDASMDFPSTFPSHPDYQPPVPGASASAESKPSARTESVDLPALAVVDSAFHSHAPAPGHNDFGRTLAIHSVCVAPPFQKQGHGRTLLKSFVQRMEGSGVADRAALLAHPELVEWYVNTIGFEDKGDSAATFGGGGWRDLVRSRA